MADPPIIANQKGDVLLFESISDVEAFVEPIDAKNGEYSIFDSRGLLLVPFVTEDGVQVRLVESSPPDHRPDELVTVLRGFLSRLGENRSGVAEDELWRMPLAGLVSHMKQVEERSRKRSFWPWRRG